MYVTLYLTPTYALRYALGVVTPQILNPVTNLEVENVFETSARISWQKNGTSIDRYILIKDGPYGESKTVIMANNDNTKVSFISDCYNFNGVFKLIRLV